jgi:hypothetical protein
MLVLLMAWLYPCLMFFSFNSPEFHKLVQDRYRCNDDTSDQLLMTLAALRLGMEFSPQIVFIGSRRGNGTIVNRDGESSHGCCSECDA